MPKHDLPYALANVSFPVSLSAENSENGLTRGYGTTVGNGIQGWAPGAVFVHTDPSTTYDRTYENVGTSTSAVWRTIVDKWTEFDRACRGQILMVEDFNPTRYQWTDVNDGGTGAVDANELAFGVLTIATDAADNDFHYYFQNGCCLDVDGGASSGDFTWEAQFNLAEANVDDANLFIGCFDEDHTADGTLLADNGAGPLADWDGFMFYKVDGGTDIEFEISRATSQQSQTMGSFTTATWHRVKLVYDSSALTVTPYLDGTAGTTVAWANVHPKAWRCGFGVKAGAGNAETLKVDYVKSIQDTSATRRGA